MPKKKPRTRRKIDTRKLSKQLRGVEAKVRRLTRNPRRSITRDDVAAARDMATELQEINRGFREALKRAVMADGKIKPGQTIVAGGRRVFLSPRPGRAEGSMNHDDYDLTYEPIC